MSLRDLMEDKQLNFNQPLLSVRRNSSIVASCKDDMIRSHSDSIGRKLNIPQPPHFKSELKSGPVSNPGVVPFFWEQIPGKPKDEVKPEADHTSERPVPKLPPGRTLVANQWNSENGAGSFNSSKAVVVDDDHYESADEGDVFLDALDTLSRTQSSVFLNCSVSNLDEPEGRPSPETFSTDPQTREFMINRFLPAAKAMASEMISDIPQYAPKKLQAEVQEQSTRQLKKVVKPDRQPQKQYAHSSARLYYQPHDYEEGSDDDDYNHEDPVKACGLLPRFCFRSSFGLLNPLPGMSVRTRVPKPLGSRMQTRSSCAGLCSGVENGESEKKLTFKSNNQRPEGSSLYKLLNSDVSANHNKPPQTNASIDASGLPKKACKSFRELMAAEDSSVQEDSDNRVAEKNLYVDTVHKLESPIPKSSSPEVKGTFEILVTNRVKKHLVDHFQDDAEKLTSVDEEAKIMPVVQETSNINSLSTTDELNSKPGRKPGNAYGQEQQYYEETITPVKAADNEVDEGLLKQDRTVKPENPHGQFKEFPVPPPLPKSPSDSWLFRTLPSLSTKNSAFHSNQGTGNPRNQAPKWETIVKTTKWQDQHLRNSQVDKELNLQFQFLQLIVF